MTPYIKRGFAISTIEEHLKRKSETPTNADGNDGYHVGHHLGYMDGLRAAITMLKDCPEEQKPEPQKPWHSPR